MFCSIAGTDNRLYGLPIRSNNIKEMIDEAFKSSESIRSKKVSKIEIKVVTLPDSGGIYG